MLTLYKEDVFLDSYDSLREDSDGYHFDKGGMMKKAEVAEAEKIEEHTQAYVDHLARDLDGCQIYARGHIVNADSKLIRVRSIVVPEGILVRAKFTANHRLNWDRVTITFANDNQAVPKMARVLRPTSNGNPKEAKGSILLEPINHRLIPGYLYIAAA